jgi:predicted lipid-binding transport protein (Tim44 family)
MLAGFDAEGFVRQAKLMFVRLQAANDTGNLDDLREFTSPEVFAEAQMAIKERGGVAQRTEVVTLEADVLESAQEFGRYVVSVRFHGSLREDANAAEAFDEIWHVTKPLDGSRGWAVAGIQQTN